MTALPDTPAGRQAQWFIAQMGADVDEAEIAERFTPSFLANVPADQLRAGLRSFGDHLPLEIVGFDGTDHELHVIATGAEGSIAIRVATEPNPPHRMIGLLIAPAGPSTAELLRTTTASADVDRLIEIHAGGYAASIAGEGIGVVTAVHHRGTRSVRASGAIAADAIFEIGSITKPVTATLLAELVADGVVALDDRVAELLPPGTSMPPGADDVTLVELATHTSGLPRLPVNLEVADERDPYATFTVEMLFAGLASTPISGRGQATYSNLGYSVLGHVLARAAGAPFEALARDRVLEPYGMRDASIGSEPSAHPRRVEGHAGGEVVPHWRRAAVTPAGGVEASADDVLAFALAHATAAPGSPAALTHVPRARFGRDEHVGLAWVIVPTDRGGILWHNGGTGGFQSFTGFHPASGTALAIVTNMQGAPPDPAGAAILGALVAST